jgi:hypothetical protein
LGDIKIGLSTKVRLGSGDNEYSSDKNFSQNRITYRDRQRLGLSAK